MGLHPIHRDFRKVASSSTRPPGGDPAAHPTPKHPTPKHPTPKHPTPKNEPLPIATPARGVPRGYVQRRLAKYPAGGPRRRRPGTPNATPNAPGATLPRTQRPKHPTPKAPNALAATQRPKTNPHGSLRRREGCFSRTYRGASQSVPPGDLVVAAGRGIQRPPSKSSYQAKVPTPG